MTGYIYSYFVSRIPLSPSSNWKVFDYIQEGSTHCTAAPAVRIYQAAPASPRDEPTKTDGKKKNLMVEIGEPLVLSILFKRETN